MKSQNGQPPSREREPAKRQSARSEFVGARATWRNHTVQSKRTIFGHIRYQPGGYCGPRMQRHYQLVVVHSGNCKVTVDREEILLTPGQVALFHPRHHEYFRFSENEETSHSWCTVEPSLLPADLRKKLTQSPRLAGVSILFEVLLRSALEYTDSQTPSSRDVVDQLAVSLMAEYLHCCELGERVPRETAVLKALHYMDEHFQDPDCLEEAWRAAFCSKTALIKKFKQSVGHTPARYLWQLRTEKGIGMLQNTGLTVSEISDLCGFSNPFHFSRRIRTTVGLSPRALRTRAWGKARIP